MSRAMNSKPRNAPGVNYKRTAYRLSSDGHGRSFSRLPHLPQYAGGGPHFASIKVRGIKARGDGSLFLRWRIADCQDAAGCLTIGGMDFAKKILSAATLPGWREELRRRGRKLVATNGCFDLLHIGHVSYLQQARGLGDALLVGLTSDAQVRQLKGPGRPVNCQADRAGVVAALESVDGVFVFAELDARHFLEAVRPDMYAKGGDYTIETINQDERRLLEKLGVKIIILPAVPGHSTSATLRRLKV